MKDRIRKIIKSLKEVEGVIDKVEPNITDEVRLSNDVDEEVPPYRPLMPIEDFIKRQTIKYATKLSPSVLSELRRKRLRSK